MSIYMPLAVHSLSDSYDSSVNDRYMYSKLVVLIESNHVKVYSGKDISTGQAIILRFVDEKAFGVFAQKSDQHKDNLFKTGVEVHRKEMSLFLALAQTNDQRIYTPKIIDIVSLEPTSTVFIMSSTVMIGSIGDILRKSTNKYFQEIHALLILKQISLSLQELQQINQEHGAICIDNIVINEDGKFLLAFIALPAGQYSKQTPQMISKEEDLIGYLSPELLLDITRKPNQQSDIYALAIFFYRILRGKMLFGGSTRAEIFDVIIQYKVKGQRWIDAFDFQKKEKNDKISQSDELPIQISDTTQNMLGKMLSFKATERPQLNEIINWLNQALSSFRTAKQPYFGQIQSLIQSDNFVGVVISESGERKEEQQRNYFEYENYLGFLSNKIQDQNNVIPTTIKVFSFYSIQQLNEFQERLIRYKQAFNVSLSGLQRILIIKKNVENLKVTIFSEYSNQGNLDEYLGRRKEKYGASKLDGIYPLIKFLQIGKIVEESIDYHGCFHLANIDVHNSQIVVTPPIPIKEEKLKEYIMSVDYFAPEIKDGRGFCAASDAWAFGMIMYRVSIGDLPILDLHNRPIFSQNTKSVDEAVKLVINSCLVVEPDKRPTLIDIQQYVETSKLFQLSENQVKEQQYLEVEIPSDLQKNKYKINEERQDYFNFQLKNGVERSHLKNILGDQQSLPGIDTLNSRSRACKINYTINRNEADDETISQRTAIDSFTNGFYNQQFQTLNNNLELNTPAKQQNSVQVIDLEGEGEVGLLDYELYNIEKKDENSLVDQRNIKLILKRTCDIGQDDDGQENQKARGYFLTIDISPSTAPGGIALQKVKKITKLLSVVLVLVGMQEI